VVVAATLALNLDENVHEDFNFEIATVLKTECLKRGTLSDELFRLARVVSTAIQCVCSLIFLF